MRRLKPLVFLLPAALLLAALIGPDSAAGADASLSVVPATQTVGPGAALSVEVKQNAPVAVSGAQVDFNFDAGLLQIVGVTKSPAYDGASFLMGVAPQTKDEAIAEANTTGTLQNVASFFLPGTGQAPAGEATFITVAMQARDVGGTSQITLTNPEMFDTGSNPFTITATAGTVNVTGATATPSPTPCPGCTPTPSPSPKPATPTPTPAPPLEAVLSISPSSTLAPPGAEFSITVMQQANRVMAGAQTDLKFDPAVLQIVSVARGQAYIDKQKTSLIYGVVPETGPAAIAAANGTGTLKNIATFYFPGVGSVPPGDAEFLTVKLRAQSDGRSPLTLANMEMIDDQGKSVGVSANNGEVIVRTGAPLPGTLGAVRLPAGGGDAGSDGGSAFPALVLALMAVTCGGIVIKRLASRR